MDEHSFEQALQSGEVMFIEAQKPEDKDDLKPNALDEYTPIIETLRRPRRHLTTAPTFTPKSFIDQIQFFDDGTNRRVYLYVNGTWRYAALT
jgi:hypothetical protein